MVAYSRFLSRFDYEPKMKVLPWTEFVDWLEGQSQLFCPCEEKTRTALISPAVYPEGARRAKDSALEWQWFAADVDNKAGNEFGLAIDELAEKLEEFSYVIYTTTSHQTNAHCYRVLFPFTRAVTNEEFPQVWSAMARWLGAVDPATKDISRMFFEPRRWSGAESIFFRADDGAAVNPDEIVAAYPPTEKERQERKVEELSPMFETRAVLKRQARKLAPSDLASLDGPCVTRKALDAYHSSTEGGRMFRFLMSVASVAVLKNLPLDEADLRAIGLELACQTGRHTDDIAHDAANAFRRASAGAAGLRAERFRRMTEGY